MAEWCAANLRNCEGWRSAGLELSTTSDENARWLDACIRQLVSWSDCTSLGGFNKSLEKLVESDPNAIMARSFIVGLKGLGTEAGARDKQFVEEMNKLEIDGEKNGNEREKLHAKAAILWGRGKHHEAAKVWDSILDKFPTDLIAVKFAHDAHFFNGSAIGKLESIEKKNHYRIVFWALQLNRFDCWATHAKAHVLEMNGRHKEGKSFMYATEDDWKHGWILASHNYWHTALFHIEFGEYEDAISIFDKEISNRFNRTRSLLDMVDASSLLWRLELEGANVGKDRWMMLKNLGNFIDNHSIVFNDVHLGLALNRQEDLETAEKLRDSLDEYSKLLSEDNAQISRTIGMPLYDGMIDFANGKYDEAVLKMYPIKDEVVKIGGSHAQRDMFVQTLIRSCMLSKNEENWMKTQELLRQRSEFKPNSVLGERLAEKFRILHPISVF
ncbi:unnamed protein product [Caenorhabditis bovis]|uniref:Tetratricopeptide repeat protein 38 n=1 Tax=Caenorhabditis bovis TaxID=2654633 RepID=A0A8S1EW09_9PELO|nr:unnamed protein product [Caenorhabditis bovis]